MALRSSETFSLRSHCKLAALIWLSFAFLFSCKGCPDGSSLAAIDTAAHDAGTDGSDDSEYITEDQYEIFPIGYRVFISDGYRDIWNRYSFTVLIGAALPPYEIIKCSGVLLSPRLVLTAGHCVCGSHEVTLPGSKAHTIIDGSRCAKDAHVETVTYSLPVEHSAVPTNERSPEEQFRSYTGKVSPHPNLEILQDERGMPLSSKADLAVIALDKPVEGSFSTIRLPTAEPKLHESFTIAGYGFDGKTDVVLGFRRFGQKKITGLASPPTEGTLFEQVGMAFTSGSGEPCLHQDKKDVVLIGITTLLLKGGTAFTSTYLHRDWLLSELRRTTPQQANPSGRQDPSP